MSKKSTPTDETTKVENAAVAGVEQKSGKKKKRNRRHRRRPKKKTRSDSVSPSISSNTSSSNSATASTQKPSRSSTNKNSSSERNDEKKKGPQWIRGRTIVMTGFQSKGRKGVLDEIDEITSMYGRLSKKPVLERVGANKQRFRATIEFSSYEAAEDAQGDLNGQATIVAGREYRWRVWFWSGTRRGGPPNPSNTSNNSNTNTNTRRRMTAREREEEQQSWWWARRKEEQERRAAQATESGDATSAPPDQ